MNNADCLVLFAGRNVGYFLKEEVKRIKADALAHLITVVELTMNEGGNKRSSPPAQKMMIEKKMKDFLRCS